MGIFQKFAAPTCRQVKSALSRAGFVLLRQKGSHEQWGKVGPKGNQLRVTVDCPKAPFSETLVKSMASQAGISKREFLRLCHEKNYQYEESGGLAPADDIE